MSIEALHYRDPEAGPSNDALTDACRDIVNALLAARDESAAVGRVIVRTPEVDTEIVGDAVRLTIPEATVTVPHNGDAKLMALYALEDWYCVAKAALEHHKAAN